MRGTREIAQQVSTPPVLLSISPDGVTLPSGESSEAARIRRELENHARDVEHFVRARRFEAIVTRVLADIQRPDAPMLRIRNPE
jgi:hypothetical protein